MKRVKKSSQTILALNCDLLITASPKPKVGTPARLSNADIGFFGSNLVVKSISNEYIAMFRKKKDERQEKKDYMKVHDFG